MTAKTLHLAETKAPSCSLRCHRILQKQPLGELRCRFPNRVAKPLIFRCNASTLGQLRSDRFHGWVHGFEAITTWRSLHFKQCYRDRTLCAPSTVKCSCFLLVVPTVASGLDKHSPSSTTTWPSTTSCLNKNNNIISTTNIIGQDGDGDDDERQWRQRRGYNTPAATQTPYRLLDNHRSGSKTQYKNRTKSNRTSPHRQ